MLQIQHFIESMSFLCVYKSDIHKDHLTKQLPTSQVLKKQ